MDQLLEKKHRIIRRSVRRFCERELRPIAAQIDQEARFPWDVIEKMGKLGYFGIQAPTSIGGADLDAVSYAIVIEEISRVSAAIGLCVTVHNSVALYPILAFGNPEQIERWAAPLARGEKIGAFCLTEPNAGSDAAGIESTALAVENAYLVNANKVFVTNGGVADICLIFCRTDPAAGPRGISVVVAERGTSGFVVGDLEDLCGMRANPVCSICLHDCRLPTANLLGREGMGLKIGLAALDTGRMGIAAQAVGIAQAALEEAVRYARQRRQFGVPIKRHQSIQTMIADMATQVDAARMMVYRAAMLKDRQLSFSRASAMAKLFAAEAADQVTDLAVQIHGGYGYSKAYPVERYYRDARVTRIYEGTSEVHRMVIAKSVMAE
ncbi:MAG: acyl-CoA dehydrogenase [Proteobacteria bacterium]|nr:MAG: acyl-CoA dehydrogenase [Pseudomonadota bacterium]PIE67075.1 MAG: acyl-CoA dehydrogenase [Deltaproteobacteria bacterium]